MAKTQRCLGGMARIVVAAMLALSVGAAGGDGKNATTSPPDNSSGGKIVGQIPSLGSFQHQLPAGASADLEQAIQQLKSEAAVSNAPHNIPTPASSTRSASASCPATSDVDKLSAKGKCSFTAMSYFEGLTIFDHVRSKIKLNPVRVAIIDTGIEQNLPYFRGVRFINLSDPGHHHPLTDPRFHGTAVASVIAAANGDGDGLNGIAERFLGNKLTILSAVNYPKTTKGTKGTKDDIVCAKPGSLERTAEQAVEAGADVVNVSCDVHYDVRPSWRPLSQWKKYHAIPDLDLIQKWQTLMKKHQNVVFVFAANDNYVTTPGYDIPAGIEADNAMTVGSVQSCDPAKALPKELMSKGLSIRITAPGTDVPVVDLRTNHAIPRIGTMSGNSMAAPEVASLAAILKSIDPGLTGADVVRKIEQNGAANGRIAPSDRILFTKPIEQVLIDMKYGGQVRQWIDSPPDGSPDVTGEVINRMCGGSDFAIKGMGKYHFTPHADQITGAFAYTTLGLTLQQQSGAAVSFECNNCALHLGTPYPITADKNSNATHLIFLASPINALPMGKGVSGSWTINSCTIADRLDSSTPSGLMLSGRMAGKMKVVRSTDIGSPSEMHDFKGDFTATFMLAGNPGVPLGLARNPGIPYSVARNLGVPSSLATSPGVPLISYIERHCRGGNNYHGQ